MTKSASKPPLSLRIEPQWLGKTGLWRIDAAREAHEVAAEEIGLSDDLAERLEMWMDEFDALLDEDDPTASRFADAPTHRNWTTEGEAIAALVRRELGPDTAIELALPSQIGPA